MDFKPFIQSIMKKREPVDVLSEHDAPVSLSGVKRLNKIPIIIVVCVILVFVIIVSLAASQRGVRNRVAEFPKGYDTENRARTVLGDLPDGVISDKPIVKPVRLDEPPLPDGNYDMALKPEPVDPIILGISNDRNTMAFQALKAKSNIQLNDLERQYKSVDTKQQSLVRAKPLTPNNKNKNQSTSEILAEIQNAIDSADDLTEAHKVYEELLAQQANKR